MERIYRKKVSRNDCKVKSKLFHNAIIAHGNEFGWFTNWISYFSKRLSQWIVYLLKRVISIRFLRFLACFLNFFLFYIFRTVIKERWPESLSYFYSGAKMFLRSCTSELKHRLFNLILIVKNWCLIKLKNCVTKTNRLNESDTSFSEQKSTHFTFFFAWIHSLKIFGWYNLIWTRFIESVVNICFLIFSEIKIFHQFCIWILILNGFRIFLNIFFT